MCIPFLRQTHYFWAGMNLTLQGLALLFTAAVFCHACLSVSFTNAVRLFGFSVFVSYAAESMGIHWGVFGSTYSYDPALLPRLPGGVPCFILLLWFDLAYMALGFMRSISTGPRGALSLRRLLVQSALCGSYIMGSDLVLDPLGTFSGMWVWSEPGRYFGTPLSNFAVWFLVGAVMCGGYLLTEKPAPGEPARQPLRMPLHHNRRSPFRALPSDLTRSSPVRCLSKTADNSLTRPASYRSIIGYSR